MSDEDKSRTIVKAVTYRIGDFFLTVVILYFFLGNIEQSAIISLIYHVIETVFYYFHERAWFKIKWGHNGA
jgi:uncharacterized membrane protein